MMAGPYNTERGALAESRHVYDTARERGHRGAMDDLNNQRLTEACATSGVQLGAYDRRILQWLAGYEPQMCQVLIGIISRAYAAGDWAARQVVAAELGEVTDHIAEVLADETRDGQGALEDVEWRLTRLLDTLREES